MSGGGSDSVGGGTGVGEYRGAGERDQLISLVVNMVSSVGEETIPRVDLKAAHAPAWPMSGVAADVGALVGSAVFFLRIRSMSRRNIVGATGPGRRAAAQF